MIICSGNNIFNKSLSVDTAEASATVQPRGETQTFKIDGI